MARKSDDYLEFEWDEGNINKSRLKHQVEVKEAEDIFFDKFSFTSKDAKHSQKEVRYQILGMTEQGRYLSAFFTYRGRKIRIISVRSMNKKERKKYEKEKTSTNS